MSAVLRMLRRQRHSKRRAPTRRPRWQAVALSIAAVAAIVGLGLCVRAFVMAPFLAVRAYSVKGTVRLTERDLRPVLARTMGEPILLVDLAALRAQLESAPGVREARVARRLPDSLEALIVERRAVARAEHGGRTVLLDEEGMIIAPLAPLPGDGALPVVRGLVTTPGEPRLWPVDRCAVDALLLFARVTGHAPPEGTTVDLTPKDRIVMRPGHDAPALWLDRRQPERNLENLSHLKDRVAQLAPGGSVDLRFPHRLTLVPAPATPDADGTTAE